MIVESKPLFDSFGRKPSEIADSLQQLAERVREGKAIVQFTSIQVVSERPVVQTSLRVEFVEIPERS